MVQGQGNFYPLLTLLFVQDKSIVSSVEFTMVAAVHTLTACIHLGISTLTWNRTHKVKVRDQPRYAPSQWKTSLQCNDVSHWMGAYLDWSLQGHNDRQLTTFPCMFTTDLLVQLCTNHSANTECFILLNIHLNKQKLKELSVNIVPWNPSNSGLMP